MNQDRSKSVIAKDIDVPKTSLPPVARSSWGAKPIEPKGDEKDGESDDDSEDQNAESVSEEEVSLEESGSHEEPVLSRPKRNNQEEDDEQVFKKLDSWRTSPRHFFDGYNS